MSAIFRESDLFLTLRDLLLWATGLFTAWSGIAYFLRATAALRGR